MKRIMVVGGTRPNYMKIAPIVKELEKEKILEYFLVHTGQHYDSNMYSAFLKDLELAAPKYNLECSKDNKMEQLGEMIVKLDSLIKKTKPDLILVVGDVNSTFAGAYCARSNNIPLAHVEAGYRCGDLNMPEEVNRILTDSISDYLFSSEDSASKNLEKSGVDKNKIFDVGDVMIDSLVTNIKKIEASKIKERLKINSDYVLVTFHRQANVDKEENLKKIVEIIREISKKTKVIFPMHPRTKKMLEEFKLEGCLNEEKGVQIVPPLGYIDFINLVKNCRFVLTDSGGVQSETTYLGVPCITIRDNIEKIITVEEGTNALAKINSKEVLNIVEKILSGDYKKGKVPELWDGKAAERIVRILSEKIK